MAGQTVPHVVGRGEHLYEIALKYGVRPADIWDHKENESLRGSGRSPEVLAPGDVLYVPVVPRRWLPVTVGAVNHFTAKVPTVDVCLKLVGADGNGAAGEPYEVPALKVTGAAGDDGVVLIRRVPVAMKSLSVRLTKRNVMLLVKVGALDPVATGTGKAQRLAHLGYLPGGTSFAPDHLLAAALDRFVSDAAPAAASAKDIEAALVSAHGS